MHQLAPEEDTGEFTVVGGAVIGCVEAGETAVSGLELGFRNGGVEMVGTMLGMVVMGVVISFWTVEIGAVNFCFLSRLSTLTCLGATTFFVLLEPVIENDN